MLLDYPREVEKASRLQVTPRAAVKKLGIGVIGAGSFAKSFILPEIAKSKDAELRSIATAHGHTARMIAEKYSIPSAATDAKSVLDDDSVHLVFILTRHDLHGPLAIEALRRGKMVYVEKPAARTFEEFCELEKIVGEAKSTWLMVGFNRVFSPHVDFLRKSFGDDPTSPGKDGFAPGEKFRWKVWRHGDGKIAVAQAAYWLSLRPALR